MPEADSVPSTPPETASATPPPTRRRALATLGWTGTAVMSGAVLGHSLSDAAEATGASPDADLIRARTDHFVLDDIPRRQPHESYNDDQFWAAYYRGCDAITDAKATTLEGLIAKAPWPSGRPNARRHGGLGDELINRWRRRGGADSKVAEVLS